MVHFLLKYLETFRDIGALLCEGGGIKYLETFRDICAVVWGGGLEYGSKLTISCKQGGLVVSLPACRLSDPSSSLTQGRTTEEEAAAWAGEVMDTHSALRLPACTYVK